MSDCGIIRAADCAPVAWKNGGGTTREIATYPAGAGMDAFAWRLSAARVEVPGAFSHFAGIDRTIAILSGRLRLEVAGRDPVMLTPDSAAYAFPGDVAAFGTPLDGPVLDLNLMVRRGTGSGTVRAIATGFATSPDTTTLLVATQRTALAIGARIFALEPLDAIRLDRHAETVVADRPIWSVQIIERDCD